MSCPDPYRPYNPLEAAPDRDAELHRSLPSDAEVRSLASALAANGGGASSEDLALDLVLNQIVEQACLATGATGAAIALTRNGEMVCRATTGSTAPDLGVRLDNAGFSAECLRVGMLQRCDDTETDPRVDAAACRLLGVRSILVVPLWYWGEFMGIFEIFSPRPNAFGERDEQTLQALAYRIVRHTKQANGQLTGFAADAQETAALQAPVPEPPARKARQLQTRNLEPQDLGTSEPEVRDLEETKPLRQSARERIRASIFELKTPAAKAPASSRDPVTTLFAAFAAVVACLILGLMIYRVTTPPAATQKAMLPPSAPQTQELDLSPMAESPAPSLATTAQAATIQSSQNSPRQGERSSDTAADVVTPAANKKSIGTPAPPPPSGGGLAIYDEKGKLIYGSPVHPEDDTTSQTQKPKKALSKPTASSTSGASSSGGATGVSVVGTPASTVKSAAARAKTAVPGNPSGANADLAEGRYVRLKPDLAESLLDDRVEPDYPDAARRAHIQGSVILETLIGANGRVQEVTPVSGPQQLAEAAATAVRQWKYKPFTVDGQKVPIRTQVTVTFMLAQ